jgi:hypothetical protein
LLDPLTSKDSPLNAISPCKPESAEERTVRHMRMCARLADLGMHLAEQAAARALAAGIDPADEPAPADQPRITTARPQPLETAAPPPAATSDPPAIPGTDPPTEAEIAAILHRARAWLRAPGCKSIDPALLFTRVAATVRDCIALEARLAAGLIQPAGSAAPPGARHPQDPRRAFLDEALAFITKTHPDRAALRREAAARADAALAADPDQKLDLHLLLFTLCDELAIEVDFAHLPDEYLGPPIIIDPHATSPP